MRVNAALTITALLATLAVARGMEFDLMDRYVPHSCARACAFPNRHPRSFFNDPTAISLSLSLIPPFFVRH